MNGPRRKNVHPYKLDSYFSKLDHNAFMVAIASLKSPTMGHDRHFENYHPFFK